MGKVRVTLSVKFAYRQQHEEELRKLEEETARRLEEEIRKRVEEKMSSEEVELEIQRRIEEGAKKLFNDVEVQLEKEKEAALLEARLKEEQARKEREELDKMLEENRRRVEEAQRMLALELQRKEEERHRELELIQRQKEEAARRKKLEEEEELSPKGGKSRRRKTLSISIIFFLNIATPKPQQLLLLLVALEYLFNSHSTIMKEIHGDGHSISIRSLAGPESLAQSNQRATLVHGKKKKLKKTLGTKPWGIVPTRHLCDISGAGIEWKVSSGVWVFCLRCTRLELHLASYRSSSNSRPKLWLLQWQREPLKLCGECPSASSLPFPSSIVDCFLGSSRFWSSIPTISVVCFWVMHKIRRLLSLAGSLWDLWLLPTTFLVALFVFVGLCVAGLCYFYFVWLSSGVFLIVTGSLGCLSYGVLLYTLGNVRPDTMTKQNQRFTVVGEHKIIIPWQKASTSKTLGSKDTPSASVQTLGAQNKDGKQNKTFASLFQDNRNPSKGIALSKVEDQGDEVVVQLNEIDDVIEIWGYSLVAYAAGGFPGIESINRLRGSWRIPNKFLVDNEDDRQKVLEGEPYMIFGKLVILKHMLPLFEFGACTHAMVPVWVTFPGLSVDLWNAQVGKICSKIGNPLYSDVMTRMKQRISYARDLVEVDVAKELVSEQAKETQKQVMPLSKHDETKSKHGGMKETASIPTIQDPLSTPTTEVALNHGQIQVEQTSKLGAVGKGAKFLPPGCISDHSPCVLILFGQRALPRLSFMFFNIWAKHVEFHRIVEENWTITVQVKRNAKKNFIAALTKEDGTSTTSFNEVQEELLVYYGNLLENAAGYWGAYGWLFGSRLGYGEGCQQC
ncbi:hypothetical protein M9H77_12653 [Catharanthus roseus]|uniref:Uncharacterized protein n=1 Tax=Catharanthus roseus TaxID=4058 RepID=A0ACC0BHY9_CATRO|nr:hypothetical protein M9H77_12653 [Catharanthus roseus]